MDPLKYVSPGSPLVITAGAWNRFIDTARRSEAEPRQTAGAVALNGDPWRPALTVLVENTGEDTLEARTILTPTTVGLDPEDDPLLARRRPLIRGATPAAATDPVLVVLDGIGPGEIGRAVVSGATVAQVSITSTSHRFARPLAGHSSHLVSAATGPVRLLVPPTSTGTKNVYVLLGGGGTSSGGGSGSGGECVGDGWRIGLTEDDEWALAVQPDGESVEIEDDATVTINGVEYTIDFDYTVPSLELIPPTGSSPDIVGVLDCTACPCFRFAFRRSAFFPDEPVPSNACSRILYVTVCQVCSIPGWDGAGIYCIKYLVPEPGACFVAVLTDTDRCNDAIQICSGPHADLDAADAECGTVNAPCITFEVPRNLVMRVTSTDGFTDMNGKVVNLVYSEGTGPNVGGGPISGWWGCLEYFYESGAGPALMTFYLSCGVPDGTTGGVSGFIGFRQECTWGTCDVSNLAFFGPFSGYSFSGPPFVASIHISGVSFSGVCLGTPGATFDVTFDITEA